MAGEKIVVVDDDKMMRKLLETLLAKEGYQVFIACNGEEGLHRINEIKPDIVILDVMMPKINGHEVLSTLRKNESTKDIPVIMLTSMEREEDISKGMALGATHYLTKPVQRERLFECIRMVLI